MRLIVFADYGLDDACATVFLLMHREAYEKIDIVPVGGNAEAAQTLGNAQKLLAAARADGLCTDGVRLVDGTALEQAHFEHPHVHGGDGMGDLFMPATAPVPAVPYAAWIGEDLAPYRILSLGPATVPVRFLQDCAGVPTAPVVLMGGCTRETPNYRGYEFNDGLDHAAFVRLLSYPHAAATLDTCYIPAFNSVGTDLSERRLLGRLVNRSSFLARTERKASVNYVHDQIAALALLRPSLFDVLPATLADGTPISELSLREEYRRLRGLEAFALV